MRQLSSYAPPFSALRLALRFGLAYELLREIRSVAHRIADLHSTGADEQGFELKQPGRFSVYQRNALIPPHSEGIQNLRISRPWLTGFDAGLYLEGREAGVLWQRGDSPCKELPRKSAPL